MDMLQVTIKNVKHKSLVLKAIPANTTIAELRVLAQQRTGWSISRLVAKGRVLENDHTLAAAGIGDQAVLICVGAASKRACIEVPAPVPVPTPVLAPEMLAAEAGGQVRGLLSRHQELLGLLGLSDTLASERPGEAASNSELPQEDLQRVLAAACGLMMASTTVRPAVLALLQVVPWELSALNTVMTMQNQGLPAIPGHTLLAGLRWSEATGHRQVEFLNACHRELPPASRSRVLQRMFLGNSETASGASACTLSLAKTFLEQGYVHDLIVAIEADSFAGPRFLAQCSASVSEVHPLLRFLLMGYQHSPRLHVATRDALDAAATTLADRGQRTAQLDFDMMQCYLRRLHGNPSVARADQPATAGNSDRDATQLALIEASWVAALPADVVPFVRDTSRESGSALQIQPAGLHNLGNTCFANAWLQALYLAGPLRSALLRAPLSIAAKRPAVVLALQRIFAGLLLSPRRALDATEFLKALPNWDCIEGWRSRAQQQDSAEFGQLLLDRVEYEVKGIPGVEGIVSNVFGGVLASTVKCECCGACSASREHLELFCLSVDLHHSRGVGQAKVEVEPTITTCELVAKHFVTENLEDQEGKAIYRCDGRCASALVSATKRLVVVEPPRHMMLTLKRFSFDGSAMKVTRRAGVSLWIWLPHSETTSRAVPPAQDQESEGNAHSQAEQASPSLSPRSSKAYESPDEGCASARMYVLYAVVVHSGTSASSGHYYTYGRQITSADLHASHSPNSPIAALAASLWDHGRAIATMSDADRVGDAGRAHAAEAVRELQEGMDAVGFPEMHSSADQREPQHSQAYCILERLASELELLKSYATQVGSTSGHGISAALHCAGNLLSQYAEATQGSPPQRWWLYNDATVSHVTRGFDAVEGLGATNAHETPYLLLYKRCDSDTDCIEDDQIGVDEVPPTVRYAVYNDELSLLKNGLTVNPVRRDVALDPKWAPPPPGGGAGGGAGRLPHRFGPAGGGAMGGHGHLPKWGM